MTVAFITVLVILYVLTLPSHFRGRRNPPPGDPDYAGPRQVRPIPPPAPPRRRR